MKLPAGHRRHAGAVPPLDARFQEIVGEATGHPVAVYQRIDQAGYRLPIDERILADTDTLMVFGLDHLVSEQEAEPGGDRGHPRVAASAKGTCLLLAPHHDVGFTERPRSSARWSTSTTATSSCRASSASASTRAR